MNGTTDGVMTCWPRNQKMHQQRDAIWFRMSEYCNMVKRSQLDINTYLLSKRHMHLVAKNNSLSETGRNNSHIS